MGFYVSKMVRACKYLFELNHYIFGQLHVLEHPLKLTGKCCSTFLKKVKNTTYYNSRSQMLLSSTAVLFSPLQRIQGSGEECQRGQCCDSHPHVTADIMLNTNDACISLSNNVLLKPQLQVKGSRCKVVGSLVQIFHLSFQVENLSAV